MKSGEKGEKISGNEAREIKSSFYLRLTLLPVFLGLVVLLPAGSLKFWPLYVYFVVLIIPMTIVIRYFIKKDPEFLKRRMKMKEKVQQQMVIILISWFVFLAGFMLPGFDHRYGWSDVSVFVILLGDILVLAGYGIILRVFKENSYASRIIEVVSGQEVIKTGPYKLVRHPMYLGVIIMYMATPVALGSYWGLIPFALIFPILVLRILNEEKVLKEQLPGYPDYCRQVRFRLIPYIW